MVPTLHRSQRAWLKRLRRMQVLGRLAQAWWEFGESSDVPPSSWHTQVSTSLSASPAVSLGRVRPPGGMGSVDCRDGDASPVWRPRKCARVCASAGKSPFSSTSTLYQAPMSLHAADPGWVLQPEPSHPSTPWVHPQDRVAHNGFAGAADPKLPRASLGHFSDAL